MRREYEAVVLEMALNGNTAEEIAAYFGYTDTTEVLKFTRKENIQPCKPTPLYGRQEGKRRALEMEKQGVPRLEIALELGVSCKAVNKICGPKNNKTTNPDHALQLIVDGYTAKEIADICGYKNISGVHNLAKKYGLKVAKAHGKLHEEMRAYKAEGHTMGEVAERFGVCKGTATQICKGIAPQKPKPPKDGYHAPNKGVLQNIENVKNIINERAPGFEYAGNYTGSDGHVDLRCKKCGSIHTASWNTLRHKGHKKCPDCEQRKKQELVKKKEAEQRKLYIEETRRRECIERGAKVVKLLKHAERLHHCPICGAITDRPKYCSADCAKKAWNANHEIKRRAKIENVLVDKDITLEALYRKNNGVCQICGGQCDWGDFYFKDNYFVVGNNYPSIDHIKPLAEGGEHSWDNVQLAHHHCNSVKGARWVG